MNELLNVVAPNYRQPDDIIKFLSATRTLKCFSPIVVKFFGSLSRKLLAPENKVYPELVALGFWLRGIARDERKLHQSDASIKSKPLGLVVHFTPKNVDTMFIYSWVCGLLMGNRNIVRVATQITKSQAQLFNAINQLFACSEFEIIGELNIFIRYEKTSHWSKTISEYADARVMWGGDDSVQSIRQLPTKPRAREISFADRYSVAAINSERLTDDETSQVAKQLWDDTKLFMQQACSSPRVLFWQGNTTDFEHFKRSLAQVAEFDSVAQQQLRNEQLVSAQSTIAANGGDYEFCNALCLIKPNKHQLKDLDVHSGFYTLIVVNVSSLNEVAEYLHEKVQTLTYAGFTDQEKLQFVEDLPINGVDRIVPIGQALDFDTTWDGFNLLESLSRHVSIK